MPASTVCSEAACLQSRLLVLWQAGGKNACRKEDVLLQILVIIKHNSPGSSRVGVKNNDLVLTSVLNNFVSSAEFIWLEVMFLKPLLLFQQLQ
jgi:hypothetical protein